MARLLHPATAKRNSLLPEFGLDAIFDATPAYASGGVQASSSAMGDLNGDGLADLVVANECASNSSCAGSVGILLSNGDGSFQAPVSYSTIGADASAVALADVNGDGHLDILVANQCVSASNCGSSGVVVLLGNGDGTFQPGVSYSVPGSNAFSIVAADLNGDGKLDLVVSEQCSSSNNCNAGSVAVLLGNGDGTFQPSVSYNSGGLYAFGVAVADLNGDGHPDLVVSNYCFSNSNCTNGTVDVLLGIGDGTFQSAVSYNSGGYYSRFVTVADLNADGKPDLIVISQCNNYNNCDLGSVGVLLGNGDGTFQTASSYSAGEQSAYSAAAADVNGDGKLDVIVADQCDYSSDCGNGVVAVLLGNGDGTLQTPSTYNSGGIILSSVLVKDVNGDGKPDILATNGCADNSCSSGSVGVLLGNGNGTFQAPISYNPGGSGSFSMAMADVNGDGKLDLLVANTCLTNSNCSNGTVGVLFGNGDGTFQPPVAYGAGGVDTFAVALADVNGDGKLDLVVANACNNDNSCNNGSIGVLLGNGDGTYQAATAYSSAGLYADAVAVGDINGDGNPDLVVANECNGNSCTNGAYGVLLGNGDGTFQAAVSYNSGGVTATSVALADVNGDGKLDLLLTNQCSDNNCTTGQVAVLLGNGDGTFQSPVTYGTSGLYAGSLAVADINGDGKLDLLVTDQCESNSICNTGFLAVLLGNGDGTFQTPLTIAVPSPQSVSQLTLADFNGDGHLDVASGAGNFLLLGNGDGTFQPFQHLGAGGQGIAAGDFNGDGKPDVAAGGLTVLLNVASAFKYATVTALTASANPANGPVSFTATVSPSFNAGSVSGSVTFYDGLTSLGSVAVGSSGQVVLSNVGLTLGAHSVTATYSGGSTYLASTSPALNETENQWTTTATLSSSQNPSAFNQSVTFTATVTPNGGAALTGTVAFMDGSTTLATVPLGNGTATYTTSTLSKGTHSISVSYGGASIDSASSSVLSQIVQKASTSIALTNSSQSGSLILSATVTQSSAGTPTGTVTFMDGATSLGSSALNGSGVATLSTSSLSAGVNNITAIYSGDSDFGASTSSPMAISADFALSASSASPASVTPGQPSTSTVTISPKNGFNPSGVAFTCSVAPASSPAPACSLGKLSVANDIGSATLTITPAGSASALLIPPSGHSSHALLIFALLIPGMLFGSVGIVKQDCSKLLTWMLAFAVLGACLLQGACGNAGSAKTTGTGGGTPAGLYAVTITGSANGTQHTTTVSITVN
ncbi:MAG: FG-GAP-like repeat-containing protein [Candidatus Sulfotelmatobacter sp.]